MGNAILKRREMMALAVGLGLTALSRTSRASVIYRQTFSERTYTYSSDVLTPPSSPSGLLSYYTGGSVSNFGIVTDPDIGTALDFQDSGQKLFSGSLSTPATLGSDVGDTLSYSFQFRIPTVSGSDNTGFRFGIFNDGGTPVTAPYSSGTAAANNDYGYSADLGVGTGENFVSVWHETSIGSGTLGYDSTNDTRLASTSTAPNISDGNAHTVLFTLTEEA